jgi:hypothetical protein
MWAAVIPWLFRLLSLAGTAQQGYGLLKGLSAAKPLLAAGKAASAAGRTMGPGLGATSFLRGLRGKGMASANPMYLAQAARGGLVRKGLGTAGMGLLTAGMFAPGEEQEQPNYGPPEMAPEPGDPQQDMMTRLALIRQLQALAGR